MSTKLDKKHYSHDVYSIGLMDTLSEKEHKLVSSRTLEKFVVIDMYNRFLIGWLGWNGHFGSFKEAYIFDSEQEAQTEIKELVLNSDVNCRVLKLIITYQLEGS